MFHKLLINGGRGSESFQLLRSPEYAFGYEHIIYKRCFYENWQFKTSEYTLCDENELDKNIHFRLKSLKNKINKRTN